MGSSDPRDALQPGMVLHRRRFGDADLVLEWFSPRHGRMGLLAKGAGRSGSRRGMLLQPFAPLLASWRGGGELPRLHQVEPAAPPIALRGRRVYCGLYLNELLLRLTRRLDGQPDLFALYAETLRQLTDTGDLEGVLRRFELHLLRELGYGVDLLHDADGQEIEASGRHYRYVPERGLVPISGEAADGVSGRTLAQLQRNALQGPTERRQAKQLLRQILGYYLGDQPLKSRELFRQHP